MYIYCATAPKYDPLFVPFILYLDPGVFKEGICKFGFPRPLLKRPPADYLQEVFKLLMITSIDVKAVAYIHISADSYLAADRFRDLFSHHPLEVGQRKYIHEARLVR